MAFTLIITVRYTISIGIDERIAAIRGSIIVDIYIVMMPRTLVVGVLNKITI